MLEIIQTIALSKDTSLDVFLDNKERYLAIRQICTYLGIGSHAQYKSIRANALLAPLCLMVKVKAADGKRRNMLCLPIDGVLMWLCTINPAKVKAESVEDVVAAQQVVHTILREFLYRHEQTKKSINPN